MPFKPLLTASIEGALNIFLYRSPALKTAHQKLNGKVLRIVFKNIFATELLTSIVLVFSECQLDVLGEWEGEADCSVTTNISMLPKLHDRQQLITLIRNGELVIDGDLQVVQNFITLTDLAEFDLAELLAPYIGDILAEGVYKVFQGHLIFLYKNIQHQQRFITNAITEEWRLAPGSLEAAWFTEEIAAVDHTIKELAERLKKLEGR